MNLAMKRLLPLLALVACGCTQAVDSRVSDAGEGSHHEPAPMSLASENAANQGGDTASAFPSTTAPTDKPSVTPNKYWVDLEALHEGHAEGHGEGHAAGHEGQEGHGMEVEKTAAPVSEVPAVEPAHEEGHEGHEGH